MLKISPAPCNIGAVNPSTHCRKIVKIEGSGLLQKSLQSARLDEDLSKKFKILSDFPRDWESK